MSSTSSAPTSASGRRRSARSTAAAARVSIQLSLKEERRRIREDDQDDSSVEFVKETKKADNNQKIRSRGRSSSTAMSPATAIPRPQPEPTFVSGKVLKVRKPKASAKSSAKTSASASATSAPPRKLGPQPKSWRAGPRRKVAKPKRRKPSTKKEEKKEEVVSDTTKTSTSSRKRAAAGKRKVRDDGDTAAAAVAQGEKKLLGPAKKRAMAAAKTGSKGKNKNTNSNIQVKAQRSSASVPAGGNSARAAPAPAPAPAAAADGGDKNKKVAEGATKKWDGAGKLKCLPFKPFIFNTNFVPPSPKKLVKGTSPFSKVHLHSSRKGKMMMSASTGKATKGGRHAVIKAGIATISKKGAKNINGDIPRASIVGPIAGTSGTCMRLSITDPSADTVARGYVPSIDACPPRRPPKTGPRLYAQNQQAPIAEETRKLEAEAAKNKRKLKKAKSASRGRSNEVLTIAPLVLRSPTFRGRPVQRVQTMMHRHIVGGEFEHVWRRIWSHSAELVTQDAYAMTPLDYAITFDAPQELLEAMLRAQCPLGTDAHTIQHPILNKNGRTQSIKSVLDPESDQDAILPYLYNDLGQLSIHRAFRNNCPIRLQKMLLHYNPELAICELLTPNLIKRLDREREAADDGEYNTLTFWSRSASKAFVDRTDPGQWKAFASSGPRCSRAHVRTANEVTSNLFDLAWNSKLERAMVGRKVFLDESMDTAEKCNDENLADGDRIAIGLMWGRFSALLKSTYEAYFGPKALYQEGELKRKPAVEIELFPELAPNVPPPSQAIDTPKVQGFAVQRKLHQNETTPMTKTTAGPAARVAPASATSASSSTPNAEKMPQKTAKMTPEPPSSPTIEPFERPEMPPPPHVLSGSTVPEPVPFVHNAKILDEMVVAPTHPALVTALLHHNVALEVITFILRLFPEQCTTKDPHSGLYPIHVVAKGLCPPFRWGWKLPNAKETSKDDAKLTKAQHVRKERERSTALIPLLLKACPESANLRDSFGRLPVHYALERGHRYFRGTDQALSGDQENQSNGNKEITLSKGYYDTGLKELLDASPSIHVNPDPKTGLYPFMLAATMAITLQTLPLSMSY